MRKYFHWKQILLFIVVVLLAFLVPITVIGLLSQLFTSTTRDTREDEQHVLERIKPVGAVV